MEEWATALLQDEAIELAFLGILFKQPSSVHMELLMIGENPQGKTLLQVPSDKWERYWIWQGHFLGRRQSATIRPVDDKIKTASSVTKAIRGAIPGRLVLDYCNIPLLEKHVKYEFYFHEGFTRWLHFNLKAVERGDPSVAESGITRVAS